MTRRWKRWLRRWANTRLLRRATQLDLEVARLKRDNAQLRSAVDVKDGTIELLQKVITRDRARLKAETATFALLEAKNRTPDKESHQ